LADRLYAHTIEAFDGLCRETPISILIETSGLA